MHFFYLVEYKESKFILWKLMLKEFKAKKRFNVLYVAVHGLDVVSFLTLACADLSDEYFML